MNRITAPCPICGEVPEVQFVGELSQDEYVIFCCGIGMSADGRGRTIREWNKYVAKYPSECEEKYMEKKIPFVVEHLREILLAKNKNYGNSAFCPPILLPHLKPEEALLVRMSDKVARLTSLASGEKDRVGESLSDTLYDLAGYCVLAIIALEKKKDERD